MKINSINHNNPNFKAVWSRQTLKTAEKVSEKTGVDVVKKLNDMLDSNPRLKQLGGDKIELSLCSKYTNRKFHYQRERDIDYYQTFCKATAQMPDGEATLQVDAYIQNRTYPDCYGNYICPHHSYESPKSEEKILEGIARGGYEEREITYSIKHSMAVNDVFDGLNKDVQRKRTQEIEHKYKTLMDAEIKAEMPNVLGKLCDYLYTLKY